MILYHNIKITFALHHTDSLKNTLLKTKLFFNTPRYFHQPFNRLTPTLLPLPPYLLPHKNLVSSKKSCTFAP